MEDNKKEKEWEWDLSKPKNPNLGKMMYPEQMDAIRGVRPVPMLKVPPMSKEQAKAFQDMWMASMPKANEINWENSPPIIYGTAGKIPPVPQLQSFVPHKMNIEEIKEWYEEFTRMSRELNVLIQKHTKGKEIFLLKSRRPGFSPNPLAPIYKAQWELYEKFKEIIVIKNKN